MSANISWRPANIGWKDLSVSAPSSFIDTLNLQTGTVFGFDDIPVLEALVRGNCHADECQRMIDAIKKHDAIELVVEY